MKGSRRKMRNKFYMICTMIAVVFISLGLGLSLSLTGRSAVYAETDEENTVNVSYIPISTAAEFMNVTDWSGNYYLTQDLDFSGVTVTKRGDLAGSLNGNGFTMKNIVIGATNNKNNALFANISGKIKNVVIQAAVGTEGTVLPQNTATLCSGELREADNILVDSIFFSSATTGSEASAFVSATAWNADITNCVIIVNNANEMYSVYNSDIVGFAWRIWGNSSQRTVENIRLYSYTGWLTVTCHSGINLSGAEVVCTDGGVNRYAEMKDIYKTNEACRYTDFTEKINDDFHGFVKAYFGLSDEHALPFVSGGHTEYSIVYETGNREIDFAVSELQFFFEEATGIFLEAEPYIEGIRPFGRRIAVGVRPADDKGLSFDGIRETGYALTTDYQVAYVYGTTGYGVLGGVYALLEKLFDLEIFYTDVYTINRTVYNLSIEPFAETGGAAFEYRYASYGEMRPETNGGELTYAYRLGYVVDYYVSGAGAHNALTLISKEEYGESHPEWFYDGTTADGYSSGTQLVFGADNFSTESGSLVAVVAEKLIGAIKADVLHRGVYGISPMDINIWPHGVGYSVSEALYQKYGTHSAEYILFMNALAEKLESRLFAEGIEREIKLELLAYQKSLCPPDLMRKGLTAEDKAAVTLYSGTQVKVVPYVAPVEGNYYLAFNDENNKVRNPLTEVIDDNSPTVAEVIQGWAELSEEVRLWWYSLDSHCYFMPLNTFDHMAENYRFAQENNVTVIYSQSQHDNAVATDWARLKTYLQFCLAKNPEADVEAAIDSFMSAYFGAGAEYMKTFLSDERAWYRTAYVSSYSELVGYSWLGTLFGSDWCTSSGDGFFWNKSRLISWVECTENAKSAVNADTDINNEEKERICGRIALESLTARYILIKVFGYTAYDGDLQEFYSAAEAAGMTKIAEGRDFPSS